MLLCVPEMRTARSSLFPVIPQTNTTQEQNKKQLKKKQEIKYMENRGRGYLLEFIVCDKHKHKHNNNHIDIHLHLIQINIHKYKHNTDTQNRCEVQTAL